MANKTNLSKEEQKKKAIELVEAFFNDKDIVVKDPKGGIHDWVSIKDTRFWNYLTKFCEHVDCYKIID